MRDVSFERTAASLGRVVAGVVVFGQGVAALLVGLFVEVPNRVLLVGVGAIVTFIGIAVLGPTFARPVALVLGAPVAALRGVNGRLARENAARNPRRTSATASALMIGVGLVATLAILAASVKASISDVLDRNFRGDFVLDTGGFGGGGPGFGLSPELAERLRGLPELAVVSQTRFGQAELEGKPDFVFAVDRAFPSILDPELKAGSFDALDQPGAIALDEKHAQEKGLSVGQTIPARFAATGPKDLRVVAIYGRGDLFGPRLLGLPTFDENFDQRLDFQVYTKVKPGVPLADARRAIEAVAADYPTAKVEDIGEYKAAQEKPIDQIFSIMYVMLLLAIIIALAGIGITLMLSVHERTRELGLLRAVGMSRGQTRSAVRWESVMIAVLGAGLGIAVGIFFGWAIVKALASQGFTTFVLPGGALLSLVIVAALCGVAFAAWPARRAARLDVLQAIQTE
jgi:putative ABC transport system permease protein